MIKASGEGLIWKMGRIDGKYTGAPPKYHVVVSSMLYLAAKRAPTSASSLIVQPIYESAPKTRPFSYRSSDIVMVEPPYGRGSASDFLS